MADLRFLEIVDCALAAVDGAGAITAANQAFAEIVGYEKNELKELKFRVIAPGCDVVEVGQAEATRAELRHRSGAVFPVRLCACRHEEMMLVSMLPAPRPMTPDQAVMEALERMGGQLADRLNSLLMVILVYSEILATDYAGACEIEHEVREIRSAASAGARIAADLVAFCGGPPTAGGVAELDRAIEGLGERLRQEAEPCGSVITLGAPGAVVQLPVHEIERAVLAIVRNATEAIGDRADGLITVATRAAGEGRVEIAITDNGPGIPRPLLSVVAEPFFSTKPRRSGMGLSLAYAAAKRAGGQILMASNETGGTIVRLVFPMRSESRPGT